MRTGWRRWLNCRYRVLGTGCQEKTRIVKERLVAKILHVAFEGGALGAGGG